MPKQLYLLDTTSASKNIDSYNNPHSFNVTFPFKSATQNIKSISSKSVEIPYYLFNFRPGNTSTTFSFSFIHPSHNAGALTSITAKINTGNYTISGLISALNAQIANSLTGASITAFTMSLAAQTGANSGLTICRITHSGTNLNLDNTLLINQCLGYSLNRSTTSTAFDSQAPINVNFCDPCLFMQISNLPVVNNNLISSLVATPAYTFKIPLNNIINNIIYFNDTSELQTITLNNNSFVLDKLDIKIYDRFGVALYEYYDWTVCFIIEYDDDVTKNQIQFLNINN
jgi:hypothetical protein